MTLDKLPSIRGDLVRTDPEWEKWDFAKLVEALNQWCRRNPIEKPAVPDEEYIRKREKLYHVNRPRLNPRGCTYCDDNGHEETNVRKLPRRQPGNRSYLKRDYVLIAPQGTIKRQIALVKPLVGNVISVITPRFATNRTRKIQKKTLP